MKHLNTVAVILAAGQGKRMKSEIPKVLHEINGRTVIEQVIETARALGVAKVFIVIGYQGGLIQYRLKSRGLEFVWQREQLGTGHAVMQTRPFLEKFRGKVLILCGDMPLLTAASLDKLVNSLEEKEVPAAVLTGELEDPGEYGRIIKTRNGLVDKIVEAKDAGPKEKKIKEVNSGAFCFEAGKLFESLQGLSNENSQKEYYLTDLVGIMREKGDKVAAVPVNSPEELTGINSDEDLETIKGILANKGGAALVLQEEKDDKAPKAEKAPVKEEIKEKKEKPVESD